MNAEAVSLAKDCEPDKAAAITSRSSDEVDTVYLRRHCAPSVYNVSFARRGKAPVVLFPVLTRQLLFFESDGWLTSGEKRRGDLLGTVAKHGTKKAGSPKTMWRRQHTASRICEFSAPGHFKATQGRPPRRWCWCPELCVAPSKQFGTATERHKNVAFSTPLWAHGDDGR